MGKLDRLVAGRLAGMGGPEFWREGVLGILGVVQAMGETNRQVMITKTTVEVVP